MNRRDQARTGSGPRGAEILAVECPACRAHLAAAAELTGAAAACPACQTEFLVPRVASVTVADAPVRFAAPPLPSTRRRPDDAFVVAEPDTATVPFDFHEPVRKITAGGTEIELRRLTADERHRRRAWRNLVILAVGAALLVALVVLLAGGGR